MRLRLAVLVMCGLVHATACGGRSDGARDPNPREVAPSAIAYSVNPAVYTVGSPITANTPSVSGGAASAFSVAPSLPTGLSLNTATGVITGTPSITSAAFDYTVTASNSAGTAAVVLNITVNVAAPASLTYSKNPAFYIVGSSIVPNAPTIGGGQVASYAVAPSLPAGLSLDSMTGVITGTPSAVTQTADYTVTAANGTGTTSASLRITVDAVNQLSVTPTDRTISLGQTKRYFATATFQLSGSADVSTGVAWESSNRSVATIDPAGVASSMGEGTTVISGSLGGAVSTTTLTVGPPSIVSMRITNGFSIQLNDGQSTQLHVEATYSNGRVADVTEQATWSVPFFDEGKVSVSNAPGSKGRVTTVAPGTAQVHAVIGDQDEVIFITVL